MSSSDVMEKSSFSVDKLGELSGRFNYEFVCVLNKRIPREYIRHGEVVEQVDSFLNRRVFLKFCRIHPRRREILSIS